MRVVLDSSVLVAAYISRAGVCAELLEEILMRHELVLSEFILGEVERKLRLKFQFPEALIERTIASLANSCTMVAPAELSAEICRDPTDVPVLATALAAEASLLITVDKDLLALGSYENTAIVKPGEFWRRTRSAVTA